MIRNRIKKGILSLAFSLLFCINFSMLASAAETIDNEASVNISREDMTPEQIELFEKLMSQEELQVGDVIVLYQTEDEIFYAEVIDSNKMVRGAEVKSKTFLFSRSVLGFTQHMFSITVVCNWISDGVNSKITSFEGSYEILASGVNCSWDSSYEHTTDTMCTLCLDYSYGSTTGYVFAGATIQGNAIQGDPVSLSISFDPH